jgi:hypothetical protein
LIYNRLPSVVCQDIAGSAIGVSYELPQEIRRQGSLLRELSPDGLRIWAEIALPSPLDASPQCCRLAGRHWAYLCPQNFTSKSKMVLDEETVQAVLAVVSDLVEILEE